MVGWHHRLNGHGFEQTLGDGEGQGSLACCRPQGCKESDMTKQLNNNPSVSGLTPSCSSRRSRSSQGTELGCLCYAAMWEGLMEFPAHLGGIQSGIPGSLEVKDTVRMKLLLPGDGWFATPTSNAFFLFISSLSF